MPSLSFFRILNAVLLTFVLSFVALGADSGEALKMLPDKLGDAVAKGKAEKVTYKTPPSAGGVDRTSGEQHVSHASRLYVHPRGETLSVGLSKVASDSAAYALLTSLRRANEGEQPTVTLNDIGTAAVVTPRSIIFYKGAVIVTVEGEGEAASREAISDVARSLAGTLDAGEGEIPALVKHLPDWETAHQRAVYALELLKLQEGQFESVLNAVPFENGTEAVSATYDQARLVIVEYATPQLATDADARINARIAQLRGEGQAVPSAYRRVGNYSVFVFDAPDEQAAAGLINKVKYEKDVRWLGENPYAVERANRAWLNMSTSVIVNTVKATGLAIVICLTIGGVFGGWIFMRRRAQAALTEKFSDAGGMLRLNIDEMSAQNNAARLIGQGDKVG